MNQEKMLTYRIYNEVDGLKGFLNSDFDEWSNFDRCESIGVQ